METEESLFDYYNNEYGDGKDTAESEPASLTAREQAFAKWCEGLKLPDTALGEVVKEGLQKALEGEKISLETMTWLLEGGIDFRLTNEELPQSHQRGDSRFYAASIDQHRRSLTVFPQLEREPNSAHIIAHELGELLQRTYVLPEEKEDSMVYEQVVDIQKYHKLVAQRPKEANGAYIEDQYEAKHRWSEMLADDIADFLTSATPQEMLLKRLQRSRHTEMLWKEVQHNPDHPLKIETEAVFEFLTEEFKAKAGRIPESGRTVLYEGGDQPVHSLPSQQFGQGSGVSLEFAEVIARFFWGV